MLRRSSVKPQVANDENNSQISKSKSKPPSDANAAQKQNLNQPSATYPSAGTTRSRTVLGVVPDNALNSQQNHNHQFPASQNDQQSSQQLKSKIPVLVDNQSISKSSPESDDIMETSNLLEGNYESHNDQENFGLESNVEDEDEDVEDDLIYNEPLSPVLTDSIKKEIDRVYSKFSRDTLDPNDEDTYDVTMVAEYGNRIFNYLHSLEIRYKPNPRYIEEVQDDLLWEHRATLMDWLVQLHSRFNLLPETLYLAVNIIDRFLSKKTISLSRFQLCGAVALFIAAKYEEINVPTVSQMVYMVGNQYPRESFLRAERFMVEVLGFEFGWPGPMSFLRRGSKADDYDNEIRTLAKYFLEITIMDARFVSSPPSWLAAGAQFLSRRMLGRGDWTEAHIYYTGYTAEQLVPLAEILEECCISTETHHRTIFQKYSERRFKRSACYVQEYLHELYGVN